METQTKLTLHNKELLYKPLILTQLYRQLYPGVQTYILNNGGKKEDTEEIMQEASLQLLEKLKAKPFVIHAGVQNYFFGICRNLWKAELRHRKKMYHTTTFFDTQDICYDDQDLITQREESIFRKHYGKLGTTTQNIWKLCFEGKNTKEIAGRTGFTEGYVRKKKCESKKKLLQLIQQDAEYTGFVV